MIPLLISIVIICLFYRTNGKVDKTCECGLSNGEINRRIVGGEVAAPYEFPWVVALFNNDKLHCGGSLISNKHILTAGHCISFGVKPTDITVYVGMHDREAPENLKFHVINGVKHPEFTSNPVRDINDIAVLTLEHEVKFSEKVRPICLPTQRMENENWNRYKNKSLIVAGWGRVESQKASSRYLLHTKVRMMEVERCQMHAVYKYNLVPESMLCAYAEGKDACQGDSGGALFIEKTSQRFEQLGIVSWGIDCAKKDFPGVYTIVPNYVNWLRQQTADGTYCRE